jgi:serine/threonine protein kinase
MNKYEILGIVGEGAYGIVYKAKNKENGDTGKLNNSKDSASFLFLQWPSRNLRKARTRTKS